MKYIGIFQGGGVKGIAHIGALKALEERGFNCVKAAGTSVGAIIASLVVSGYTSDEMTEIIKTLDLASLRLRSSPIKVISELGLYSSIPLLKYLDNLYVQKKVSRYLDLKEGKDYRLKVIGTDLSKRKQIVFPNDLPNYFIDPDNFKISTSVVMSATYPLFYKPFKLSNHIIVDGSIANNFPLDVFGAKTKLPVIGFNLVGEKFAKTYISNHHIIRIPIPKVKTMDFKISSDVKRALYLSGYYSAVNFIEHYFS